jgi:hypothetical protein
VTIAKHQSGLRSQQSDMRRLDGDCLRVCEGLENKKHGFRQGGGAAALALPGSAVPQTTNKCRLCSTVLYIVRTREKNPGIQA